MKRAGRYLLLALLAACLVGLAGCPAHNPSYFPHAHAPFGEITPTHAKPGGHAYYANFDPHAISLTVRPINEVVNPVGTQHVLMATLRDEKETPRRARRIEWLIQGEGRIVEVDEHGFWPWQRGYKSPDNMNAVSYTNYFEHKFERGNKQPGDDFVVRPGQSWCVITSAKEGDTHVTVVAPEINDWEKRKVTTLIRWVDAFWAFPLPQTARSGTEAVLTTKIFRQTDKKPLSGYRVHYTVLDGPAAMFASTRAKEAFAISDLNGNASVGLIQPIPAFGVSRIGIEIIRPPEGNTGTGVTMARGETTVEWLAPAVALSHTGPANAALGAEIVYATAVNNVGKVEARSMTVTSQIPEGLQFVSSVPPPAAQEGARLTWLFGMLQPGQAHNLQTRYRSTRQGQVTSCAAVVTEEGLRDEKCATTVISVPALKVSVTGPAGGGVGSLLNLQVAVTNPGSGPAENVRLQAEYDAGLEHDSNKGKPPTPLNLPVGALAGGETKTIGLPLTAKQMGRFRVVVIATADGGLRDQAEHVVVIQQPQARLDIDGPKTRYQDRPADFTLKIVNTGEVPLTNLVVRDRLPPELGFVSASGDGKIVGGDVEWNVGTLGPREERTLNLSTRCQKLALAAVQQATLTADSGIRVEAQKGLEILGIPALRVEMRDLDDPVEVGKRTAYLLKITNTGSLPANGIEVKAVLPDKMKYLGVRAVAKEQVIGQTITFAKVDGLEPNKTLEYFIDVEAVKPGDARFRTEVFSPDLRAGPVIEEESTRIVESASAAPMGPVPPPPVPPNP